MENLNIFRDIAERTGGDIYLGVVGPVRTGKSTFIKRLMELLVLPNIEDANDKERAVDELPQSGAGRMIMTVEPKFIPQEAVQIVIRDGLKMKVRMVDCVGYTVIAANKVDDFKKQLDIYELYKLGLGDPVPISSLHGLNIDELLDRITVLLPQTLPEEDDDDQGVRIAVVGRPNVGKSSLVNALLSEKRVIVSDVPGTTRDAIDTKFLIDDRSYTLIDTAGIRRRSRVSKGIEYYGVQRALRAIDRADVVLLVIDATEGIVEQDKKIAGYIEEMGKGVIIIINKWDQTGIDTGFLIFDNNYYPTQKSSSYIIWVPLDLYSHL
jgi:small GTP-binding protein